MDAKYYDERYFGSSRIFGSAAPSLDQPAYERPEPEVEARPRERVSIRTEAKPVARQHVSLFAVGGCVVAAGLAIMLLLNYVELNAISSRTYELSGRLQELQVEETRLKIEYESTFKLDEVEQYATNMLGMVKAESGQVKYLDDRAEDQAVVLNEDNGNAGFMAKMKSLLTSISEYFK